jgi:hypothetical protein
MYCWQVIHLYELTLSQYRRWGLKWVYKFQNCACIKVYFLMTTTDLYGSLGKIQFIVICAKDLKNFREATQYVRLCQETHNFSYPNITSGSSITAEMKTFMERQFHSRRWTDSPGTNAAIFSFSLLILYAWNIRSCVSRRLYCSIPELLFYYLIRLLWCEVVDKGIINIICTITNSVANDTAIKVLKLDCC